MEIVKVRYKELEYHPQYRPYQKKHPLFFLRPVFGHLSAKGVAHLLAIHPISIINKVDKKYVVAGLRTYLAAEKNPPSEVPVVSYAEGEMSGKAIHEMVCADFFLSLLPYAQGKGDLREAIMASQAVPDRMLNSWFSFKKQPKYLQSVILPVTSTFVGRVLDGDDEK